MSAGVERRPARPGVLAEELAMCPRCESRPGEMCVTISGAPAWVPHSSRSTLGQREWTNGFVEGAREALDMFERLLASGLERTADGEGRGDLAGSVQSALARSRRAFII